MQHPSILCPATVDEALSALGESPGARLIAGGTDALVQSKRSGTKPPLWVSLEAIAELRSVEPSQAGGLSIGAAVTLDELEYSKIILEHAPLLAETAHMMASPPVRSRATVGGNLCNASPAADLAPPMLVHEATALLASASGTRRVPVAELLEGPGHTCCGEAEILVSVEVPKLAGAWGTAFEKHQVGLCASLSIVSVAAAVELDSDGLTCTSARIALGAVAPTALRLPEVEALLGSNRKLDEAALAEAGQKASELCAPIDDVRSTCDNRCHIVSTLVPRAVARAAERAREAGGRGSK